MKKKYYKFEKNNINKSKNNINKSKNNINKSKNNINKTKKSIKKSNKYLKRGGNGVILQDFISKYDKLTQKINEYYDKFPDINSTHIKKLINLSKSNNLQEANTRFDIISQFKSNEIKNYNLMKRYEPNHRDTGKKINLLHSYHNLIIAQIFKDIFEILDPITNLNEESLSRLEYDIVENYKDTIKNIINKIKIFEKMFEDKNGSSIFENLLKNRKDKLKRILKKVETELQNEDKILHELNEMEKKIEVDELRKSDLFGSKSISLLKSLPYLPSLPVDLSHITQVSPPEEGILPRARTSRHQSPLSADSII